VGEESNLDKVMSDYYGEDQVAAIITVKADTKEAENIALAVAKFELIEDVFLVTGDTDIIVKARFENYAGLKEFVLKSLAPIKGIKDTKTLMVVTTYKERGVPRVFE
jgi:DNA-binding Lrp family transcriptional regulator